MRKLLYFTDTTHVLKLLFDNLSHKLWRLELNHKPKMYWLYTYLCPVHFDYRDNTWNVIYKLLICSVQSLCVKQKNKRIRTHLEILEGDSWFTVTRSHLDAPIGLLRGDVKMNDNIRLAHEVWHIVELQWLERNTILTNQVDIGAVVSVRHHSTLVKHASKDRVFINSPVLDTSLVTPNDLLVLPEAGIQKKNLKSNGYYCLANLKWESEFGLILIEVLKVDIVNDRLKSGKNEIDNF